jgi:hypothetical protein
MREKRSGEGNCLPPQIEISKIEVTQDEKVRFVLREKDDSSARSRERYVRESRPSAQLSLADFGFRAILFVQRLRKLLKT